MVVYKDESDSDWPSAPESDSDFAISSEEGGESPVIKKGQYRLFYFELGHTIPRTR